MKLPFPDPLPWCTSGRRETPSEIGSKWALERESARFVPGRPLVSWILVGKETKGGDRDRLVRAIEAQSYDHWEILSSDGEASLNFVGEANRLASLAKGEWLIFAEPGDVPSPVALFQFLREAVGQPKAEVLLANEAILNEAGALEALWSKPELSWVSSLSFNGVGRSWMIRRALFLSLEGFADLSPEEARWDLLSRAVEGNYPAHSTPAYLWYSRSPVASVPSDAMAARLRASLVRRDLSADVVREADGDSTLLKVKPIPKETLFVSALVCFRDRSEWTVRSLEALARQKDVRIEVVLVDNQSSPEERAKVEAAVKQTQLPYQLLSYQEAFHYARMNNEAAVAAKGDFLLFLNNDVFLSNPEAVAEMAAWAQVPGIGTTGLLLRFPDGRVQHDGIRATHSGGGRLVRVGHFPLSGPFLRQTREVFANTFACCLVSRAVFEAVGALDELDWVNGFGDVAFQLLARHRGYRHLFLGHLEGTHLESASRGLTYEYWEELSLERRFAEDLQAMARNDLSWTPPAEMARHVRRDLWDSLRAQARVAAPELVSWAKKGLSALRAKENNQSA